MRYLLILSFLIGSFPVDAQSIWEKNRKPYVLTTEEQEIPLYYLYRAIGYDYKYDEQQNFVCDLTYHEIVSVNNDKALGSKNKIYIPISEGSEILSINSRVISKDGKTSELDQRDIREIKDDESSGSYRIFAVEGAEVGSEIEYRYIKRMPGSVFYNETIQLSSPIKQFDFSVRCPENLEFEFVSVNHDDLVIQTDTVDTHNLYELTIKDIEAYQQEDFSGLDANKMRIDLKLCYNKYKGAGRINTFSDAGVRLYNTTVNLTKAEQKVLNQFVEKHTANESDKLRALRILEHEVKKIFYEESQATDDLTYLFKNGFGHSRAFLKLFVGIIKQLGLSYELVVTSSRLEVKFNKDFDTWNQLNDFLIYLPDHNLYMAPHRTSYRLGNIPPEYTATYGLFVRPEMITDFEYPISRIDYIKEKNYKSDQSNLDIKVSLDESLSKTKVDVTQQYVGGQAYFVKAALHWMSLERQEEMLTQLIKYLAPDADIKKKEIVAHNNNYDNWDEPFVMASQFETEGYLEQAGNSLILQVGALIGPQSEMYQDKERKYAVENRNNRGYFRKISIEIPDGYTVKNADDIVMNEVVVDNDKEIFIFKSSYQLDGKQLNIEIEEFYNQIYYPAEKFEAFRKVVNAAADWNKVALVLKKEGN